MYFFETLDENWGNDMTKEEAYLIMQKHSGLKVGDTVKVLREAKHHENGWDNSWTSKMNKYIGNTYTIYDISQSGITLGCFYFPFFVLEKIESTKSDNLDDIPDFQEYNQRVGRLIRDVLDKRYKRADNE